MAEKDFTDKKTDFLSALEPALELIYVAQDARKEQIVVIQ